VLKIKAEEELRENFRPIYERRLRILEAIMDIKAKIASENIEKRKSVIFN
jgi:hypothetical protein